MGTSYNTRRRPSIAPVLTSVICHWVILPTAAWNHNLFLVIIAAFAPLVLLHVMRRRGSLPQLRLSQRERQASLVKFAVITTVTVVIFWNHWWLLAIGLSIFFLIRNTRISRR